MAGSIIIPLLTGFDSKGIKEAETALASLGGKLKSFGKTAAISMGSAFAGAGAVSFVKSSVGAAAELQQAMSGTKTIFGELQPQIEKFIQSGTSMGMSMAQTAKATTFLGSVFKQTGMPMDEVIGKTETMVSLASDLAATYGYSVEDALTAMTATFRGEYDPIEKFGVAMKQQQVNAVLAAEGMGHLTGAALIAAQQQVRYNMILERTADAQGAFVRQSGNLLVQQAVLKATWTDMQAKLGNSLVPILAKFATTLQPLVVQTLPHLSRVFDAIGQAIIALMPLLPQFMDILTHAFDVMSTVMTAATPALIGFMNIIVNNLPIVTSLVVALVGLNKVKPIVEALRVQFRLFQMEMKYATIAATYLDEIAVAVRGVNTEIKGATVAQILFNRAVKANPYILAAAAIGLAIGAVVEGYNALAEHAKKVRKEIEDIPLDVIKEANRAAKQAAEDAKKLAPGMADPGLAASTAWQNAIDKYTEYQKLMLGQGRGRSTWQRFGSDVPAALAKSINGTSAQTTTKTAVKTWFDSLAEEVKKQADRVKLQKLGAGEAFINSVLGAADWDTVASKLIAGGKSAIKKFQSEFNKTAAGIDAAQAAADAAAKDLADRQQKYVDAVSKRLDTIKSLTADLGSFIPKTLAQVNAQVGTFESDVISAADTLRSSLATALDTKDTKDAYNSLLAYANAEIDTLQKLAQARDKVAARIEAAKSVYLEVAQAVRGYGNITATTTQQVTESYMKIIDGVEVTVTRTVDALQNKDLVATYKNVVDKTKAFVAQLRQLKSMGLNATLFKQIIDAGVDAGSATADAIVSGGQDTVNSLNDLFGQLDSAGAQMADMTAQVMENNGVTIVSAFIDGLASEESALSDKAAALGKAFSDAFNAAVNLAIPQVDYTKFGLTAKQAADALAGAGLSGSAAGGDSSAAGHYTPDLSFALASGYGAKSVDFSAMVNSASTAANADSQFGSNTPWAKAAAQYNVTVNAGIGTDGAAVGAQVVNVIKQYERNNGAVWVAV